jgi:hypothetical protein
MFATFLNFSDLEASGHFFSWITLLHLMKPAQTGPTKPPPNKPQPDLTVRENGRKWVTIIHPRVSPGLEFSDRDPTRSDSCPPLATTSVYWGLG